MDYSVIPPVTEADVTPEGWLWVLKSREMMRIYGELADRGLGCDHNICGNCAGCAEWKVEFNQRLPCASESG